MIWAYVSFSQFLIIWSGNLPETITWYKSRSQGGWQWVAVGLFLFSFALPFVILLSRWVKRQARLLAMVAGWVLFMRLVELFWIVQPSFRPTLSLHWMDVAAPIGVGGFWLAFYIRQLKSRPLLPQRDPRMHEAFADVHAH
jgi:xanthine/uracil permease